MSLELDTPQEAENIGRGGIKIPELVSARLGMTTFFGRLFELNGLSLELGGASDRKEFVIPAGDEKPLVVITAEYDPTKDPDYSRDDFGYSDWKLEGTEIYSVMIPPTEAGPFEVIMRASQGHFSGHGLSYPGERVEQAGEDYRHIASYKEYADDLQSRAQQIVDLIS